MDRCCPTADGGVSPSSPLVAAFTEVLRGRRVVLWVDRDAPGHEKGAKVYAALKRERIDVAPVQAVVPEDAIGAGTADAYDHLEHGGTPDTGERIALELDPQTREALLRAERFAESSIAGLLAEPPTPRRFLFDGLMPENEAAMLAGPGGAGKGFLINEMLIALALGEPFGPHAVTRPRSSVVITLEEDREEMARRLWSAMQLRCMNERGDIDRDAFDSLRETLCERLRIVSLRGLVDVELGAALREEIAAVVREVDDCGLVVVDPIGRALPVDIEALSTTREAGRVVGELDAIREACGCAVLAVHHFKKGADAGSDESATGSKQLVDYVRLYLTLSPVTDPAEYNLDPERHYVQLQGPKTNYAEQPRPLFFHRGEGGALAFVKARSQAEADASDLLSVLFTAQAWLTREEWFAAVRQERPFSSVPLKAAMKRLVKRDGSVERFRIQEGRNRKDVFAPADRLGIGAAWPDPPTCAEAKAAADAAKGAE